MHEDDTDVFENSCGFCTQSNLCTHYIEQDGKTNPEQSVSVEVQKPLLIQ